MRRDCDEGGVSPTIRCPGRPKATGGEDVNTKPIDAFFLKLSAQLTATSRGTRFRACLGGLSRDERPISLFLLMVIRLRKDGWMMGKIVPSPPPVPTLATLPEEQVEGNLEALAGTKCWGALGG